MFVIVGYETIKCELFDSLARKFVSINFISKLSDNSVSYCRAVCVDNEIIIFIGISASNKTEINMYDVDTQMWSNVDSDFCKNLYSSEYVKYYKQ